MARSGTLESMTCARWPGLVFLLAALSACSTQGECLCRPFVTLTLTTPSGQWKGGDYELRWAGTATYRCRQFLPQPEDTMTATPRADCDPGLALSVESVASATVGRSMVVHAPTYDPVTCSILWDGALVLEQALTVTGYGSCDCQADPIAMTVPADP